LDVKSMMLPSPEICGQSFWYAPESVVFVTWASPVPFGAMRKISQFPSALVPNGLPKDQKTIELPPRAMLGQ
jgi:hypothetical protein